MSRVEFIFFIKEYDVFRAKQVGWGPPFGNV